MTESKEDHLKQRLNRSSDNLLHLFSIAQMQFLRHVCHTIGHNLNLLYGAIIVRWILSF